MNAQKMTRHEVLRETYGEYSFTQCGIHMCCLIYAVLIKSTLDPMSSYKLITAVYTNPKGVLKCKGSKMC